MTLLLPTTMNNTNNTDNITTSAVTSSEGANLDDAEKFLEQWNKCSLEDFAANAVEEIAKMVKQAIPALDLSRYPQTLEGRKAVLRDAFFPALYIIRCVVPSDPCNVENNSPSSSHGSDNRNEVEPMDVDESDENCQENGSSGDSGSSSDSESDSEGSASSADSDHAKEAEVEASPVVQKATKKRSAKASDSEFEDDGEEEEEKEEEEKQKKGRGKKSRARDSGDGQENEFKDKDDTTALKKTKDRKETARQLAVRVHDDLLQELTEVSQSERKLDSQSESSKKMVEDLETLTRNFGGVVDIQDNDSLLQLVDSICTRQNAGNFTKTQLWKLTAWRVHVLVEQGMQRGDVAKRFGLSLVSVSRLHTCYKGIEKLPLLRFFKGSTGELRKLCESENLRKEAQKRGKLEAWGSVKEVEMAKVGTSIRVLPIGFVLGCF